MKRLILPCLCLMLTLSLVLLAGCGLQEPVPVETAVPEIGERLPTPKEVEQMRKDSINSLWADGWEVAEKVQCQHGAPVFNDLTLVKTVNGVETHAHYCPLTFSFY